MKPLARSEQTKKCHQARTGFGGGGEVETQRSGARGRLNGYKAPGIDPDRHRIHAFVDDLTSFVEPPVHQTQGGADSQGEAGTERSKVRACGHLD